MTGQSLIIAVLSLLLLVSPAWATEDQEKHNLIRVSVPSPQKGLDLQRLDLDIIETGPDGTVFLIAQDGEIRLLSDGGFRFEIVIKDLETFYKKRLLADPTFGNRAWPEGSMGGYFTNSEVEDELDAWAAIYPDIITPKISIGTTVEGRDIWAVKISDNPNVDEEEPEICLDSCIHPREVMGMMTVLYYMKNLLEGYGIDPELTYLVNNREIWFIPVHNPDGHVYNELTNPTGGGLWRKNRRNNGGGIYGVDLARNYGFKWGYDNIGSNPNPSSISYRGPSPFSEPEAQAVRDFITSHPIVTSWNTHTFTNVYICPFSYDSVLPYGDDWPLFQEYLKDISVKNGYPGGPSPYTLGYFANGTPLDWQYGNQGVICLAPEIGTWDDGFWPPKSRIIPLAEENQLAIEYWSWVAGSYARLHDHSLADDNGDGLFHPGEPIDVILTVRNKGLAGTVTDVTATLSSSSPYVTVIKGTHSFGTIPDVTSANNTGSPLKIKLSNSTPYGSVIFIDVDISFDGYTLPQSLSFECGIPDIIYSFDMENDPGWTVGDTGDNAVTGIWERDNPIGTMEGTLEVQPEDDHTASPGSECFVTGNGSSLPDVDDVDAGKTTLKTSIFDLSGVDKAMISYWRWYADLGAFHSNNDIFHVDISNNNGVDWVSVEALDHTENYWREFSFRVSDLITPSDRMMMRFIARDEPDDSLCEACIDDFEIKTYSQPVSLDLLGTPKIGTTVNIAIDSPGDGGLGYLMVASLGTYPGIPLAGGRLFPLGYDIVMMISLKPAYGIFVNFSGVLDGAGHTADPAFVIPNMPSIVGLELFAAAVTVNGSAVKNISAPLVITIE